MKRTKPSTKKRREIIPGIYYNAGFLNGPKSQQLKSELEQLHPIWEERFSKSNPPPEGDTWRQLKRPVYWLGNWQFACHGYYHPPEQIHFRCVQAEAFPPFMQQMVREIEFLTRKMAPAQDIPEQWCLNTCLVNYYGAKEQEDGKFLDMATVGDHKDAEPGPVASVSLGERSWFQFVKGRADDPSNIVHEQWLDTNSLLIFWGKKFKDDLFHRVQRVENRMGFSFEDFQPNYRTRRINLTFRYVPREHIYPFQDFPVEKQEDVKDYIKTLATYSEHFRELLAQFETKRN